MLLRDRNWANRLLAHPRVVPLNQTGVGGAAGKDTEQFQGSRPPSVDWRCALGHFKK